MAIVSQELKDADGASLENGEYKRRDSKWRNWISSEPGSPFPPVNDRYHLFVSYACPWAHRTLMVRALKGLEDAVTVTYVHPVWKETAPDDENDTHCGWIFGDPSGQPFANTLGLGGPFPPAYPGNEPDPICDALSIRELYELAEDKEGRYTVPVLWDKKMHTIVSNESADILRMFNSAFNEFAKNPDLDLYPKAQRNQIDTINEWVYATVNNGVYKCGFAKSQKAYDKAIDELTKSFDNIDGILQQQKYIAGEGENLTEADVRLFVTLLRFDEVYAVYFKTNTRSVAATPSMMRYMRDIYHLPGISKTCNMDQIKAHYYASHPNLNRWSVIPRGPNFIKLLEQTSNSKKRFEYEGDGMQVNFNSKSKKSKIVGSD